MLAYVTFERIGLFLGLNWSGKASPKKTFMIPSTFFNWVCVKICSICQNKLKLSISRNEKPPKTFENEDKTDLKHDL